MEADAASTQTSTPQARSACEYLDYHTCMCTITNVDYRSILGYLHTHNWANIRMLTLAAHGEEREERSGLPRKASSRY
jgi:hypothetical protein